MSTDLTRAYRSVIREARDVGVTEADIATVISAFAGEPVDEDEFRTALMQYVPLTAFHEAAGDGEYMPIELDAPDAMTRTPIHHRGRGQR